MRDVVSKALRGLELAPSQAAEQTGIPEAQLMQFLRGGPAGEWLKSLGPLLGLDLNALESLAGPRPLPDLPPGLQQWILPFEEDEVNVWWIDHPEGSLMIDTGFQAPDLERQIEQRSGFDLLITHPHRDHIGGWSIAQKRARRRLSPAPLPHSTVAEPGQLIRSGPWLIKVLDLRGHHPNAVGYHIRGGGYDLVAVGDAVFAGSIGGCAGRVAYERARRTILAMWATLSPDTLILTGHGPATTVALESQLNPFIAGWNSR